MRSIALWITVIIMLAGAYYTHNEVRQFEKDALRAEGEVVESGRQVMLKYTPQGRDPIQVPAADFPSPKPKKGELVTVFYKMDATDKPRIAGASVQIGLMNAAAFIIVLVAFGSNAFDIYKRLKNRR